MLKQAFFLIVLALACVNQASATPSLDAYAEADVSTVNGPGFGITDAPRYVGGSKLSANVGGPLVSGITTEVGYPVYIQELASSDATAFATFGTLHASASANTSVTAAAAGGGNVGGWATGDNPPAASAQAGAGFDDALSFYDIYSPQVASFSFEILTSLHGSVVTTQGEGNNEPGVTLATTTSAFDAWQQITASDQTPKIESQIVTWSTDVPFDISERLIATVPNALPTLIDPNGLVAQGIETADASNTAEFAIKVLTPGISYVADSGTVYPTDLPSEDIPEPSSLWLLSSFVALATMLRAGRC